MIIDNTRRFAEMAIALTRTCSASELEVESSKLDS